MESDERFKHLASDPRFKTLRKKQKKVQIDDRFQSMFTDEKFTLKYSRDKRGRKQKKTSGDDLKRYYELEDDRPKVSTKRNSKRVVQATVEEGDEGEEEEEEKEVGQNRKGQKKVKDKRIKEAKESSDEASETGDEEKVGSEDEDENDDEDQVERSETESEVSSSSDEAETEDEGIDENDDDRLNMNNIQYDWQPLDHDAETAEITTRRLAIQNLDWDRLDVKDIYTLINSVRPPVSVKIYVSEFGKERLKQERLEGPKEIIEMTEVDEVEEEYQDLKGKMEALKNPASCKVNEYEDADEELDLKNDEIRERVRRYQLSKMKYYYAVVEFDSVETAELVYKELDGREYEGSSLELDLRFIPDDIEFDPEDLHSECDKVPDLTSYQAPQFINSALQQTTVKFTWDETDVKRQEKLHKAYTKQELDKDDLDAYLASATDSDEDEDEVVNDGDDAVSVVTANSEARINKYKMLLKRLDEEAAKKKKIDVDIEWGNYSEDEEKLRGACQGSGEEDGEDDFDSEDEVNSDEDNISDDAEESDDESREQAERQRRKKKSNKKKKKKGEKHVEFAKSQDAEDDGLDLLVMEDVDSRRDEFKFNPDDERFKAIYESGAYNIDPSHPNFKRTQAFDTMAEKKREKRQKTSV